MLKLSIFNMKEFIKVVNECTGPVILVQDERKLDLNKNDDAQCELQERYNENGNCLLLYLNVPNVKDYFNIVISFVSTPL